jgi:hypothetical protein
VNLYLNASTQSYNIYSFSYGSLATAVKVKPPKIPIYLSFDYPGTMTTVEDSSTYIWDYLNKTTSSYVLSSYQ